MEALIAMAVVIVLVFAFGYWIGHEVGWYCGYNEGLKEKKPRREGW